MSTKENFEEELEAERAQCHVILMTAAAGNAIYGVFAPDRLGTYVSAGTWGLERRLRRARARVMRKYEKRRQAFSKVDLA